MSNACSYGEERLAGLLYDDGDQAELVEMRAHLADCEGCRAELEGLTSMKDLLSAWPNAVNAPRMVYVNERVGMLARLRRWVEDGVAGLGAMVFVKPAIAMATALVVLVAAATILDVRVAPDGRLQVGLAGGSSADPADLGDPAATATAAPVSREELEQSLTQAVEYLEELFQSRRLEDRRVLIAAIDERMDEQGLAMSDEMRTVVSAAFSEMESQHEGDLGLVFSAIDEMGYVTSSELQRMNTILASLMQQAPEQE